MPNLKMLIEYDGTDFFGWQHQPGQRTVQGEIEGALHEITGEKTRIIGAGRTDQGVHALGQVANVHTLSTIAPEHLRQAINSNTGDDLYIKHIEQVEDSFHSRYSAKSKVYQYSIVRVPMPLVRRYNWFTQYHLNVADMRNVIPRLVGEHDFSNFSAKNGEDNTVCILYDINLTMREHYIIITIEGNRFLRKMIRGIVGFMHDVGRGRFTLENTDDVFSGNLKDIYFVPAHGLCLVEVKY